MEIFKGKTILVTGGCGSVGSLLVSELLQHDPSIVRVLDNNETKCFYLEHKIRNERLRVFLGDIRDRPRLDRALENVDIVFHCAALKHVGMCEYNPFEAVKTNVLGTQNIIDASLNAEVERVIFASSDKAVNPTNVMGSTKLLCERLITAANYYKGNRKTILASVRFGNVFGSRGSVVPLFKKQIKKGGPVTLTEPNMTRFVMMPHETIQLIFKAAKMAQKGEVFILKMPSLRLGELAESMIELYGHKGIKIQINGPQAGEKFHEELMTEHEAQRALENEEMFILIPEMKELQAKFDFEKSSPKGFSSKEGKLLSKKEIISMLNSLNRKIKTL